MVTNKFIVTFHDKDKKPVRKNFTSTSKVEVKREADLYAMEREYRVVNISRVK